MSTRLPTTQFSTVMQQPMPAAAPAPLPAAQPKPLQGHSLNSVQSTRAYWSFADLSQVPQADVLVVLAHPDDEVFLSGSASQLARSGYDVQFVYVTNGKAGRDVSGRELTYDRLGEARSQEVANAIASLGITRKPIILDFMDGEVEQSQSAIEEQLRSVLVHTRPQTVLTFRPQDGITDHPDHKAVGKYVDHVFQTIFNGATPRDREARLALLPLIRRQGVYHMVLSDHAFQNFMPYFPPGDSSWAALQSVPNNMVNTRVALTTSDQQLKQKSLKQHQTQFPASDVRGFEGFYNAYPYEEFVRYQLQNAQTPAITATALQNATQQEPG